MADPEEDKKIRRPVSFRLRPVDRKRFMTIAAARGLTPGQLARQIIAQQLGLILPSSTDRRRIDNGEILRQIVGALGQISQNLSEWHTSDRPSTTTLAQDLQQTRVDLDRHVAAILNAMGGRR